MQSIATRAGTRAILERYGLHTRKRLGQHYLVDPHVLEKILRAADVTRQDCVLEIGPGLGAVTEMLAASAGRVCAVELDTALIPILQEQYTQFPHVKIHHGDILKLDPAMLLSPYMDMNLKVVANLPYYVTTPVIMHLLEKGPAFTSFTVMVQKEVAERMAAHPGTKNYGALTLAIGYYGKAEIAAYVPPNCFMPRPRVDSAVVHLRIVKREEDAVEKKWLFQIIHAAFNQRRKTLVNALTARGSIPGDALASLKKEDILPALARAGLPADVRGEALDLASFTHLASILYDTCIGGEHI